MTKQAKVTFRDSVLTTKEVDLPAWSWDAGISVESWEGNPQHVGGGFFVGLDEAGYTIRIEGNSGEWDGGVETCDTLRITIEFEREGPFDRSVTSGALGANPVVFDAIDMLVKRMKAAAGFTP